MKNTNLTKSAKFAVMVDTRNSVGQPFCFWAMRKTKKEACSLLGRLSFSGQVIKVYPQSSAIKFYVAGY
jgi:hypothetical protein